MFVWHILHCPVCQWDGVQHCPVYQWDGVQVMLSTGCNSWRAPQDKKLQWHCVDLRGRDNEIIKWTKVIMDKVIGLLPQLCVISVHSLVYCGHRNWSPLCRESAVVICPSLKRLDCSFACFTYCQEFCLSSAIMVVSTTFGQPLLMFMLWRV